MLIFMTNIADMSSDEMFIRTILMALMVIVVVGGTILFAGLRPSKYHKREEEIPTFFEKGTMDKITEDLQKAGLMPAQVITQDIDMSKVVAEPRKLKRWYETKNRPRLPIECYEESDNVQRKRYLRSFGTVERAKTYLSKLDPYVAADGPKTKEDYAKEREAQARLDY